MRCASFESRSRTRSNRAVLEKSARELRQGGSDYRCCIPALAGFVSPQSIAPDGKQIFSQQLQCATPNSQGVREQALSGKISVLTNHAVSVCIDAVKFLALLSIIGLFGASNSCTTLVNRRDLYSPEPAPDSLEAARQWYGAATTRAATTTTTRTTTRGEEVLPPPELR
jgi:hypothetical protein